MLRLRDTVGRTGSPSLVYSIKSSGRRAYPTSGSLAKEFARPRTRPKEFLAGSSPNPSRRPPTTSPVARAQSSSRSAAHTLVDLIADVVPTRLHRRDRRLTRTHERVEHHVALERVELDAPVGQLDRERRGMSHLPGGLRIEPPDALGELQELVPLDRALPSRRFSLEKDPLEKTRMYSWVSLSVGLLADSQLPQAVEGLLLASFAQMISPRIRNPSSSMSSMMNACSGMYGLLPRFATLMQHLPPGTRTRSTSAHTLFRNSRYSSRVRSLSYSFPTLYGGEVTMRCTLFSGSSSIFSLDLQRTLSRSRFLTRFSWYSRTPLSPSAESLVEPACRSSPSRGLSFRANRRNWSSSSSSPCDSPKERANLWRASYNDCMGRLSSYNMVRFIEISDADFKRWEEASIAEYFERG